MGPVEITEDSITAEISTLWEFFGKIVDWDSVKDNAEYIMTTYDGVSQRLDGMSYDEKLMIHALLSLGATLGRATNCVYVVMPGDDDVLEGELN